MNMNNALRRFLHNYGNIVTEGSQKLGLFEPGTSGLQASVDTNEPSGTAQLLLEQAAEIHMTGPPYLPYALTQCRANLEPSSQTMHQR